MMVFRDPVTATSGVGSEAANAAYQCITDLCFASPAPEIVNRGGALRHLLWSKNVESSRITDALQPQLRHT